MSLEMSKLPYILFKLLSKDISCTYFLHRSLRWEAMETLSSIHTPSALPHCAPLTLGRQGVRHEVSGKLQLGPGQLLS